MWKALISRSWGHRDLQCLIAVTYEITWNFRFQPCQPLCLVASTNKTKETWKETQWSMTCWIHWEILKSYLHLILFRRTGIILYTWKDYGTVLCAKYQNDWMAGWYVVGKRDFTRFSFKVAFGQIFFIAQPLWSGIAGREAAMDRVLPVHTKAWTKWHLADDIFKCIFLNKKNNFT